MDECSKCNVPRELIKCPECDSIHIMFMDHNTDLEETLFQCTECKKDFISFGPWSGDIPEPESI